MTIDDLDDQPTEASKNRDDFLKALAFGALALVVSLSIYVYVGDRRSTAEQLADIRGAMAAEHAIWITLQSDVTRLQLEDVRLKGTDEHRDSDLAYWKKQITEFRKEQIVNTQAIALFKTKPAGRFDPFTGEDGRVIRGDISALRKDLTAVEHRVDKQELCCQHISGHGPEAQK